MERLTERNTSGIAQLRDIPESHNQSAFEALAKYEELEEKGLLLRLPCKIGDTIYVIATCEDIIMYHDDDYENGTGAIECPFESQCINEECHNNKKILKTIVSGFIILEDTTRLCLEDIKLGLTLKDLGKTVFLTPEEAEQTLRENRHEKQEK